MAYSQSGRMIWNTYIRTGRNNGGQLMWLIKRAKKSIKSKDLSSFRLVYMGPTEPRSFQSRSKDRKTRDTEITPTQVGNVDLLNDGTLTDLG